jgi:hypothetical protein
MARLTLEDRLQKRNAFELVRIGLIVGRSCNIEHNRVADLSLIIVRITLSQGFHRLQVRLYPLAMWDSLMIRVESEQSVDIVTLALHLSAERPALFQRCQTERKILCRRRDVRIEQETERNSPVGNRAFGVGRKCFLEQTFRLAIPE